MVFGNPGTNRLKIPPEYEELFRKLEREQFAKKKIDDFGRIGPMIRDLQKNDSCQVYTNRGKMEIVIERKKKVRVNGKYVYFV